MKNNKKHSKNEATNKNSLNELAKNPLGIMKKYKGFTIALIAVIVILAVYFSLGFDLDTAQQKAQYAKQMHENNVQILAQYQAVIDETSKLDAVDTLEDDYSASMKDDLAWLKEKENNIYLNAPRSEIFSKEIALTMLLNAIMQVNSDYAMETTTVSYDEKINEALNIEVKELKLLTIEEINAYIPTETDKQTYKKSLDELWRQYLDSKQTIIKLTNSKERQYVEARKLVWLTQYYNEETA